MPLGRQTCPIDALAASVERSKWLDAAADHVSLVCNLSEREAMSQDNGYQLLLHHSLAISAPEVYCCILANNEHVGSDIFQSIFNRRIEELSSLVSPQKQSEQSEINRNRCLVLCSVQYQCDPSDPHRRDRG